MPRGKPQQEEESTDDQFIKLVQEAMEATLKKTGMEPKDKNALFANCIKFIAVKNKLKGEEGDFFND